MNTALRAASVLCLAFALLANARAAVPSSLFVEDLTWTELRDEIRAGKTTILVPIGGTEQNGPHMALGKHNARARALAEKIARALGNALVAPVIAYVPEGSIAPPTQHMKYPGTITIPPEAFEKVLEYAAKSFRLHGFRDVVFLADHGGYLKSDRAVAERLNREWAGTPARAHAVEEYYRATETEYPQALKRRGLTDAEIGTHAGLADTSLALAVDPRLVRTDMLQGANLANVDGIRGDPKRSSAELGQLGVDAIVARTTAAIRQATAARH